MRYILHADLDAFYASVEQLDDPSLSDKPVVVGGAPEKRGVVAAASYHARKFGVHSAMPMRRAMELCPHLVRIPPRFSRYREISQMVMEVLRSFTDLVEPISLDEAYLDITANIEGNVTTKDIAVQVQNAVKNHVGLTLSIGVSTSKSVAKIASDINKPNGLVIIDPGEEEMFIAPLPVNKLWGVGPKTAERLLQEGVRTVGQLAAMDHNSFTQIFGKRGEEVRQMAMGLDQRGVIMNRVSKSISAETTISEDSSDFNELFRLSGDLLGTVWEKLVRKNLYAKTLTLKLRTSNFQTYTRSFTTEVTFGTPGEVRELVSLMLREETGSEQKFRLIGLRLSNFVDVKQLSFYEKSSCLQ